MINSRHTGMIIWIIKILRRLHDTFYKQNALSLAFRQRVGVVPFGLDVPKTQYLFGFRDLALFEQPFLQYFCNTFFQKRVFGQIK